MIAEQVLASPPSRPLHQREVPLTRLVYRSRAALPLMGRPLAEMLRVARRRNQAAGVTGLLMADGTHYLQWLEGPAASLGAVMNAISADPRHGGVEILADAPVAARRFAGWDMRLAAEGAPRADCPALHLPGRLVAGLWTDSGQEPDLLGSLGATRQVGESRRGTAPPAERAVLDALLTALAETGTALDSIAPAMRGKDARRHFVTLIEPAARRLGDLWMRDALSEAEVTMLLCRMQTWVRQLGQGERVPRLRADAPHVLVAPLPGEMHALGAVLATEWLWLSGWQHEFDIFPSDAALCARLAGAPHDMLELSLSPAFHRLDEVEALRRRLAGFRAASCNRALRIRLSGRLFAGQPWLAGLVGADAVAGGCEGVDAALWRLAAG
nr:BLUF domain-containing protein [Roseococcus suduntuyensis]